MSLPSLSLVPKSGRLNIQSSGVISTWIEIERERDPIGQVCFKQACLYYQLLTSSVCSVNIKFINVEMIAIGWI
jgi:hypothetical protein